MAPSTLTSLNLQPSTATRLRRPWEVIDEEILPELTIDLVFGDLRKLEPDGKRYKACCPIHGGTEGDAFLISPNRLEWLCFLGCGGGGPVQFLQKTQKLAWMEAAQALAVMAGVDPAKLQVWGQHWTDKDFERHAQLECRSALLQIFVTLARSSLLSASGKSLRAFLQSRHGMRPELMPPLELGLYSGPAEVYSFLKKAGQDLQELRTRGFFDAKWTGRLVVPWRDLSGRIVNLWSWNPSAKLLGGESAPEGGETLFERDQFGSQQTPFLLRQALEREIFDLILLDSPLEAMLCASRGVSDPFPVAGQGKLVNEQVDVLDRALAKTGSLTLLTAYDPETSGKAGDLTARNLKSLDMVGFPVFVVDSRLLAGQQRSKAVRPSEFVRSQGTEAFSEVLKQSEVVLGGAGFRAREAQRDSGLGRVFRGLTRRDAEARAHDDPADVFAETGSSRGQTALIGVMLRAAEELGQRIAQGFLRALPGGFSAALPEASEARHLQLPGHVETEPPPDFSVDRLEKSSRETALTKSAGWREMDGMHVCFRPGELTLLGGRTGHGRTSALTALLVFWLYSTDENLVFFSFDESEVQIYHRLLSLLTAVAGPGLPVNLIRNAPGEPGSGGNQDWMHVLENARECLRGWESRLKLVYRPGWAAQEVDKHVRTLAKEHALGAVLIDPLDKLVLPAPTTAAGRARWLKSLAVDLACPVVASVRTAKLKPAKLKKKDWPQETEPAPDHPLIVAKIQQRRPRLSDFGEDLEQDADQILGILCHAAVYSSLNLGVAPETAPLEIGVLKNRSGPTGDWVTLQFDRPCCLIRDPEPALREDSRDQGLNSQSG